MVPSARLADVPADQPAAGPVPAGTGKGAARSRSPPGAPRSRSREFLWRAPARSVRPSMPGGVAPSSLLRGLPVRPCLRDAGHGENEGGNGPRS